jgi:phage shock protein A
MEERDLGALIENGLKDLAGRIDESRVETRQRFEQLEGEIRQTRTQLQGEIRQLDVKIQKLDDKVHVQLEHVRGDIRLVAEGVANVNEKLDRHIGETAREFEEVRSLTRLSYVQLEKRVSVLESRSTIS